MFRLQLDAVEERRERLGAGAGGRVRTARSAAEAECCGSLAAAELPEPAVNAGVPVAARPQLGPGLRRDLRGTALPSRYRFRLALQFQSLPGAESRGALAEPVPLLAC